ncbi:SAM pointed domain-containing Ets transcription factor [Paramuricea clavata]|uniref:SAM pointed domain-containing Ets transcription factor n=2 Tax=Paramuricea clavata TaxID=317549 RepID=A0A7D9IE00_PARCT|nr:SAM pointed domain-containing Ets transcription factor [Paramuricea clavata]
MNRACVSSNNSDYGYYADPNLLHRNDSMGSSYSYDSPVHSQNSVSDWIKTSMIMGDHLNFDYFPDLSSNTLGQEDRQGQYLVYKTQQLVQSRSFDDCTCSSYSSDVPQCTCDNAKTEHLKPSLDQDPLLIKPELYKTPQDTWFESEYNRIQKEKFMQSLAVPDPSLDYSGYYLNYEGSIYEPDPVQTLPLPNPITEKSPAFTGFQRVPKIEPTYNAPSPITTSPVLKQKSSRPRLCHFLLELLANPAKYSDIVEWVDQDNGVFKFLNSSEVASQWGRRRNKPHMKYENFARSLRTYIAKGILTKPRSKLVYRFTSQVY